tara:strand:- start:760 stop:2499 length:1740 start_codon:yes stop_codon:yes gene_type:complete
MYRTEYYHRSDFFDDGDYEVEDESITFENNWLFAFADTMIANIVPTNPEVTIRNRREELKEPAKLRELLVNDVLYREKAHSKLWKLATRSAIFPRAFLKCVWSEAKGRPILRVLNPEFVFFDAMAEDWEDVRYVCEVSVLTRGEFEKRIKKRGNKQGVYRSDAIDDADFGPYPEWLLAEETNEKDDDDHEIVRESFDWITVYEYYDLVSRRFFHYMDGSQRPILSADLPYDQLPNPYYMLYFNDNLKDLGGLSDAELVFPTIARLNEMSSLEMWHNKCSIPVTVVHSGLVDDPAEFEDALENVDGPGQVITIAAKPKVDISQVMGTTPMPTLPVEWQSTKGALREQIEFVLGIASYQRGGLGQSDVATELALADTAIRTRNSRRQKVIYDCIAWTAKGIVALYSQFLPSDSEIPIRLGSDEKVYSLTRESLAFEEKEDPLAYDYEARPFNAQEGNSVVQLKTLTEFIPVFTQNPATAGNIDQRKLVEKLLELLQMPNLLTEQQQGAAPPGMPGGMPGMPGMPAAGAQLPAQGLPPELAGLMQGGEVQTGDGEQAITGAMEGGMQVGGKVLAGSVPPTEV